MTLAQVAELSGVSRSTASRVLNGDERVSDDARDRVLRAADSIGYRPNRAARSLASGRSSIVGLVLPTEHLTADPYGSQVISGVVAAANERDQQVMLWLTHQGPDETVQTIFRNGIVDGLIVAAPALGDDWVEELIDGPMPTVLIGRHPTRRDVNVVDIDDVGGARLAVDHLVGLGHRRIATITGNMARPDAAARYQGYVAALEAHGIALDERLVAAGTYTPSSGVAAMVRLLKHRPTAVFAANDQMAHGAYEAIEIAGLRIPEDVSVVGFDGFSSFSEPDPPLTTVRQDLAAIGEHVVDVLLQASGSDDHETLRVTVGVELVERSSTGPPATGPPP
ncbi:MAG: LacI family DNA-binding transcriptional regulator [Actinomycetota bacterium]